MRRFPEAPIVLTGGVDTSVPPITSAEIKFYRLKNVQPRDGRLTLPNGHVLLQELGAVGGVTGFTYYTEPTSLYSSLYALTPSSVRQYDFATELFGSTIYSGFSDNGERYVSIPWYDRVYVSKLGQGTVKLQSGSATLVSGIPAGRYGICAHSHLMYANISTPSGMFPSRVQWSDLYEPEDFVIDTDSQADYFDTEQADGEITGLSYQRGNVLLYVRNAVWIVVFNSSSGKYKFEPLFTGIGNMYHHAQVRVKEIDFFIASDGIYVIDGLQLKNVGEPIWAFFKSDLDDSDLNRPIVGTLDTTNGEVFWTYLNKSGASWQIVYNYKEDAWSDRESQNELCRLRAEQPIRGFSPIDTYSNVIDTVSDTIDGSWQFDSFNGYELIGSADGNVYRTDSTSFLKADASSFECVVETFDFFFDKTDHVKEIHSVMLQHKREETPTPEVPPS